MPDIQTTGNPLSDRAAYDEARAALIAAGNPDPTVQQIQHEIAAMLAATPAATATAVTPGAETAAYAGPVLDADGHPVDTTGLTAPRETLRQFFAGRVRAPRCPHYMYASERAAGMTTCERCPAPATATAAPAGCTTGLDIDCPCGAWDCGPF